MRAATTFAAIAAGAAVLFAVAGAGADSEDPTAIPTQAEGPRHQLLGSWRSGRGARFAFSTRRGRVSGRATAGFRLQGCRVRRGAIVFRGYRFARRDERVDVWEGRVLRPTRSCRARYVPSRISVVNDLRAEEFARVGGRGARHRLRRIRPRPRSSDPVLATWERMGGGVVVGMHDGRYVGTAREDFLISNGCRVPAGTPVWSLRPSAPGRYDGVTQTFLPPPSCDPSTPARSRWSLSDDGRTLVREAADGTLAEYERDG